MFTGIISDIGRVRDVLPGGDPSFLIETRYDTAAIELGASIACSGVCLTVVETGPDWFRVQASRETLELTTAGAWKNGTRLNLERALRMGDELGGHIVSGHVDGIGTVAERRQDADSIRYRFEVPPSLDPLIARKGSIAIDGISLTVNEAADRRFAVNIIPHTQSATTFDALQEGDAVNLEVDMLARYVARLLEAERR